MNEDKSKFIRAEYFRKSIDSEVDPGLRKPEELPGLNEKPNHAQYCIGSQRFFDVLLIAGNSMPDSTQSE